MLNGIYTIKICLLIMYWRLTLHHSQRKWVMVLAVYVAIGWMATQITYFAACRPFSGYWALVRTANALISYLPSSQIWFWEKTIQHIQIGQS